MTPDICQDCGKPYTSEGFTTLNAFGEQITVCPECAEYWKDSWEFYGEIVGAIRSGALPASQDSEGNVDAVSGEHAGSPLQR